MKKTVLKKVLCCATSFIFGSAFGCLLKKKNGSKKLTGSIFVSKSYPEDLYFELNCLPKELLKKDIASFKVIKTHK